MLEEPDPFSNWNSHDYRLQEAMHTLDRDTCKTCGNPSWLCHTPLNTVEAEIRKGACYFDAELKDYDKSHPGEPELEAGEYRYAVAVGIEGENGKRDPLPSRAEALAAMRPAPEES